MGKKSKKIKKGSNKDQLVMDVPVARTEVPSALRPSNGRRGSEKQIKWICDMLDGKVLEASSVFAARVADLTPKQKKKFVEELKTRVPDMSYDGINQMIGALKVLPNKSPRGGSDGVPEPRDAAPGVGARVEYRNITTDAGVKRLGIVVLPGGAKIMAGSYGVKTKKDDRFANNTSFFKLWIGDRGGWNLQMYVSDDLHRVQMADATKMDMLKKISKDPYKAAALFGWEFKRCGICGRGLTADESRERGIGPVCAGRL